MSMDDLLIDEEMTPEWHAEQATAAAEKLAAEAKESEQLRAKERSRAAKHPREWAAWVKVEPLLEVTFSLAGTPPYDFEDFLADVGAAPSGDAVVVRKDESGAFRKGNMRWSGPEEPSQDRPAIPPPGQEGLSINEAAALKGLHPDTIRRAVLSGELPAANVGTSGRARYLISRAGLEAWLERRRNGPAAAARRKKKAAAPPPPSRHFKRRPSASA